MIITTRSKYPEKMKRKRGEETENCSFFKNYWKLIIKSKENLRNIF